MKQLMNALKTVRRTELLVIAAAVCVLLILCMGNTDTAETLATDEEMRMARFLTQIEGVEKASVMISHGPDQQKSGVAVAAVGTDDIRTLLEIQRAVQTLTGLDLNQIEIVISRR